MGGAGDQDRAWQDERRKEFKEVIDLNDDGKVDERELKVGRAMGNFCLKFWFK